MKCVLDSSKLSGDGRLTDACQTLLEQRLGTPTALLTPSCTDALELAALLIDVGPGDEVILPSFTFSSTANAFCLRSARPVFVDVHLRVHCMPEPVASNTSKGLGKTATCSSACSNICGRTCRAARQLILIVDNYIIHKWRLATAWLNHNPEFRLLFQPAYQPWVNDIERLCKQLHDNITRNHQYATIDPLMDAVRAFMQAASPFPGNCPSVARFGSRI